MKYAWLNAAHVQIIALMGIAALSLSIAHTQTPTARNVRALEHAATTSQQFAQLAAYFAQQAAQFHTSAKQESTVLAEEEQHPSAASKYPHTADRARMLRDYYQRRADEAHQKEELYASRAQRH